MAGKCFLVTGPPGVGKTTLIIRVFERLSASNLSLKLQGFYTREIRERGQRIGFQVVTLDSRTATLASTSAPRPECLNWPSVGRFKVDLESFESLALPELQAKKDTDLFIIDEVGKMELYTPAFFPAVLSILESNISILATVPIPVSGKDIPAVATLKSQPGATLFTLTKSNREAMCDRIYTHLVESMNQK